MKAAWYWSVLQLLLCALVVVRIYVILPNRGKKKKKKKKRKDTKKKKRKTVKSTLVVMGSGGHTGEMCTMMNALDNSKFEKVAFVIASSDKRSIPFVKNTLKKEFLEKRKSKWFRIPRSRSVKQSKVTSIFTTIYSVLYVCLKTYPMINPDLILVNGPGTCIPIVIAAWIFRFWGRKNKIIFTESLCRVDDLSVTGKLLYSFVDRFIVQWEKLHQKYPQSEFLGGRVS